MKEAPDAVGPVATARGRNWRGHPARPEVYVDLIDKSK
jgi:hypothetical protein